MTASHFSDSGVEGFGVRFLQGRHRDSHFRGRRMAQIHRLKNIHGRPCFFTCMTQKGVACNYGKQLVENNSYEFF
jgi:hypothetical protein